VGAVRGRSARGAGLDDRHADARITIFVRTSGARLRARRLDRSAS
jgi:hypothetical protein